MPGTPKNGFSSPKNPYLDPSHVKIRQMVPKLMKKCRFSHWSYQGVQVSKKFDLKIKKNFVFDFKDLGPSPLCSQTPKTPILTPYTSKSVHFKVTHRVATLS